MTRHISEEGPTSAPRRDFFKTGGALVVTYSLGACTSGPRVVADQVAPPKTVALDQVDGFLAIDAKGRVTVY